MQDDKINYIQLLVREFGKLVDLPTGFEDRIQAVSRVLEAPRLSYVEFPGEAKDGYLWYIVNGFAHSLVLDKYLHTSMSLYLWKKNDIIASPQAIAYNSLREHSIQLLEDSTLVCIPNRAMQAILNEWPLLQKLLIEFSIQCQHQLAEHTLSLGEPAEYRVRSLLEKFPGIHYRVNQTYLAHYLGMGRSTFNFWTSKISRQK